MLQARSANHRNGSAFVMSLKAKDIYIGSGVRADYNGTFDLPAFASTQSKVYVYLWQPLNGSPQIVARLSTDNDHPDPERSRLVSAFGAYNYSEDTTRWGAWPITFRQTGHDIWFDGDAVIEDGWELPANQQWTQKVISDWVPDGVADMIRLRVEVGAVTIGANDSSYFVQANIASESNGVGSKEVKGRSPAIGNNKYLVDLIEVPLAERKIWVCGTNARADILCFGFRLNT